MKWYFCIDELGSNHEIGAWAEIAVESALKFTNLSPVCLFDGPLESGFAATMKSKGVEVMPASSRLAARIDEAHRARGYPVHARGAFLRAEVPSIARGEEYALYTDCDVFFLREPVVATLRPAIFSAGPRMELSQTDQFNSGVLYFNVEGFRAVEDEFLEFAGQNLGPFLPGIDEPILNAFFGDKFDQLPVGLNWRPFFGFNTTASIVHFHGPKMQILAEYVQQGPRSAWGAYSRDLHRLIATSLPSYFGYLDLLASKISLPESIAYHVDSFLRGYPNLLNTAVERMGDAMLDRQELLHRDAGAFRSRAATLLRHADRSAWSEFSPVEYVFGRPAVSHPNILFELFAEAGLGRILSATARYDDGRPDVSIDLGRAAARDTEIAVSPDGRGWILTAASASAAFVIEDGVLTDRERIERLSLECLECGPDVCFATFAYHPGRFYSVNRVAGERVAA